MSRDARITSMVEKCGYGAAALTLLPIPGSEIIGVMPLHVDMVVAIGKEYGQELTKESATELVMQIGGTVGLSLLGSRVAMTAGKILLPGLGGLVAAPFMYASTLGIGRVAQMYFENGGLSKGEMSRVYESAVKKAKKDFDPRKAKSAEAREIAEEAAAEGEAAQGEAAPGEAAGGEAAPSGGGASAGAKRGGAKVAEIDDLAERLATLEALHQKGHITAAEYERRREAILDEI